ncbi:MAG: Hpt domain-containing protein [Pseudobdellovibrionaceae bacterium]|nr:Hpt domain-containing protein [Pseudobdellovibrionaceae bacterium]
MRTLYPVIRPQAEALSEHTSRSFPLVYLAGWFGLLGFMVLAVALMRRQVDLFLYFGLMAVSVSSWVLFNQDSLIKPYTGLPPRSWSYFDLIGIYLSGACLISFLSIVAQSKSRLIRFVFWMNWGMALTVALASAFAGIHAWYLLPLLHIAVFPSLLALIPLIIWSAVHRNTEARVLMIGSLAIALSSIHDIIRYSSNFKSPLTTMIPFGGLVMLMAMLMILIRRYQAERDAAFQTQARLLADIQGLNAQLQVHVEEVEALVEEKTREIGSILSHIQQGIFMLTGPDLKIHAEYSQHLETVLDTQELAYQSFESIFLNRCRMGADQRSRIKAALETSLGEEIFNFEVNAANLPQELVFIHDQGEKILELSWSPIADENNLTDKILITARDVTSLRQLQLTARRNQEEMQILQIILSAKPERFARFLDSSLQMLARAGQALGHAQSRDIQSAFRDLHTVKGNARTFELNELASMIHDVEMILQQSLLASAGPKDQNFTLMMEPIQAKIEGYKNLFDKSTQLNSGTDRAAVGRQELEQLFQDKSAAIADRLRRFEELLLPQIFTPADAFLRDIGQGLGELASNLGKLAPELAIESHGIYLTQAAVDLFSDCLGHLLRNALDHGIESPSDRLTAGKSPKGRLFLQCRPEGEELGIYLRDDGHGLHLQKIRQRALDRGLMQADEVLTEARVEQLIFSSGFSTKNEASIISGRGVGLDAVRAALEHHGGTIRMRFTSRDEVQGAWLFHFEMFLPAVSFIEIPNPGPSSVTQQAS